MIMKAWMNRSFTVCVEINHQQRDWTGTTDNSPATFGQSC